jgi:uncharacterized metal-binding protein
MIRMSEACCSARKTLIFACSGGSNVGQITNEAAKKLDQEGLGSFYCLAGLGARLDGFIANAQGADEVIAIDGCPVACARKILEAAEVPISTYVVATELGIEKGHHFNIAEAEVAIVCDAAKQAAAPS